MKLQDSSLSKFLDNAASGVTKKYGVAMLRWLLIIASSAVLLSILHSAHTYQNQTSVHVIIILLLVSNVVVSFLPSYIFEQPKFVHAVVVSDIVLISAAMWLTGSLGSDFYLLYFVIIMISAVSGSFKTILATSIIIPTIYVSMVIFGSGSDELLKTDVLLRIPFFFVASVFYGYLVSLVRKERSASRHYKESLETATYIGELSQKISDSLERNKILDLLVEAELRLCAAKRAAVISRTNRKIVSDSSKSLEKDKIKIDEKFFEISEEAISKANYQKSTSEDGGKAYQNRASVVKIPEQDCTLIPVDGSYQSDLFLVLFGELAEERLQYSRVLLVNAAMALKNAGQYQALVREADKRMLLAQQLSSALERKTEFLRNMSHQLRTPISSLIGFAELLLDNDYGQLSKEQATVVARMLKSSDELQSLTSKIVRFSRLDGGQVEVSPEAGSSDSFFKELLKYSNQIIEDYPLEASLKIDGSIPALVLDWTLLKQITETLISNAIKFTEFGEVKIVVKYLTTTSVLVIEVKDTGPGISQAQLNRVFYAFNQIDKEYSRQHAGSGLSLAITKKQVEVMGGEISVRSQPGEGTVFTVSVPAEPALTKSKNPTIPLVTGPVPNLPN